MTNRDARPRRSTRDAARSTRGQPPVSPESRRNHKRLIAVAILAVLGAVLLLYQPVMNHWIGPAQLDKVYASANALDAKDIRENTERHAEADYSDADTDKLFDADSVQSISALTPNPVIDTENVVGGVYAPTVGMVMPVMYGFNQQTLLSSAGTMKPEQQMGKGNYALIGHNSKNPDALFAPTHRLEAGDAVHVTDKTTVYTYEVTERRVVQPHEIEVIDDVPGETILTLISCTDDGEARVVVQAELVAEEEYVNADTDVIKAFNDL